MKLCLKSLVDDNIQIFVPVHVNVIRLICSRIFVRVRLLRTSQEIRYSV